MSTTPHTANFKKQHNNNIPHFTKGGLGGISLLTSHLDIWTAADTVKKSGRGRSSGNAASVYGIRKLRELILELAVRGKLVPQDANDEPASELLKRIQIEKAKLIAEGKIKNKSPSVPLLQSGKTTASVPHFAKGGLGGISEDEMPYLLPQGWEWVRLPEVYYSISPSGSKLLSSAIKDTGKVPVVDQGKSYIAGYTDEISLLIKLPGPVIVFGDHTTERKYIDFDFVAGADGVKILRPVFQDERFFIRQLESYSLEERGYARHFKVLNDCLYALPPLAEQHRIVAKVDELMVLCDQLETQHNNAAEAHEKLVSHLLATLTQSQSAADFSANWQRIAAHFDTLFTTEISIDALKQTLLQLAVMGKLVPQDTKDEPASELLKRIQAEKAKLIVEGKIKKDKPLPAITDGEKPYELPQGWKWVRLQEIIKMSSGDGLTSEQMSKNGNIPVFGGNGITGFHSEQNIDKPTLVIGRVGFYCGSVYLTPSQAWITDNALVVTFSEQYIWINFLYWLLRATNLKENESATAQPLVTGRKIYPLVVGLPPLEEQRRIVAKVDELMALCEQMKTRLTVVNQLQQKLADVMVEQAVS